MAEHKPVSAESDVLVCPRCGYRLRPLAVEQRTDPGVPAPGVLALKDGTFVHGHDRVAVQMVWTSVTPPAGCTCGGVGSGCTCDLDECPTTPGDRA